MPICYPCNYGHGPCITQATILIPIYCSSISDIDLSYTDGLVVLSRAGKNIDLKKQGASGNLAATRFRLRYTASRYNFSSDNNLR